MVFDFLKGLGRSRVSGVETKLQAKKFSAVAKAKSKVSTKFNAAVDAPMKAAQKKAAGGGKAAGQQPAPQQKDKGGQMGLFGGKNKGQAPVPQQQAMPEMDDGMQHTRAINIEELVDDRSQDCVGWVVALSGELKGRDFRLTPGKNVLGTSATCDVVLTDQYMSGRHATINYEDQRFTLIDLDSTNGTYLNDKRVSREELIDNDRVRLGRTELKFKSLF
jgi:hypothetical protein